MLGQLLDGIAAILEDALSSIDIGDGAATGSGIEKPRVIACEPGVSIDCDLVEVGSADCPVCDRDLVLAPRAVVANAQGLLGRINRGRIRHAHNLRVVCEAE